MLCGPTLLFFTSRPDKVRHYQLLSLDLCAQCQHQTMTRGFSTINSRTQRSWTLFENLVLFTGLDTVFLQQVHMSWLTCC